MALRTITTDLCFAEGPRWYDGALWFSDMHDHVVCRIDADGRKTVVAEVPQQPSGLGWLPDGRLLILFHMSTREESPLCYAVKK